MSFPLKINQTRRGSIPNGKSHRRYISRSSPKRLLTQMGLFLRGYLQRHNGNRWIRILE